jgi:hypothetical protein
MTWNWDSGGTGSDLPVTIVQSTWCGYQELVECLHRGLFASMNIQDNP